ncbi:MAG: ComF family protein [Polyangiaceae bacterium]|nr:ComF family protein [Polyangiaceae bacterium]
MHAPWLDIVRAFPRLAFEVLSELVAPTRCAACDVRVKPRTLFCTSCMDSVLPHTSRSCREHAIFAYGGAIAKAITRCKYDRRADLAPRLGEVMAASAESFAGRVDVVVSVPIHPKRLVERGFDQAALIARPVAKRLAIAWRPRTLARTRDTPRQASLDRDARATNVSAAFIVRAPEVVVGRRVLLVDDVRTTGATLSACAEVLRAAGAQAIVTMVLAEREWD